MTAKITEKIVSDAKEKYLLFLSTKDKVVFEQEVKNVCNTESRLFPYPLVLDLETTELFRSMCTMSHSLIKVDNISNSHRPVIGKMIVATKKVLWKLVKPQINDSLLSIQHCFSNLVVSHARLTTKLLETTIPKE